MRTTVFDWRYWSALAALVVAGLLWPAERRDRHLSSELSALAEDGVWFVLSTLLSVTMIALVLTGLATAYTHLIGHPLANLTPTIGVWGVALVAFVLSDLLAWTVHWAHHHVPTLWLFHAVHHSQTRMNALSDNRTHVVENLVAGVIAFVPALALGLSTKDALLLSYTTIFFSALIHANLRTNLGLLGYVFVSPQAHRIHHSVDPQHFDTNYATVFAFWDRLFRTHHPDRTTYPATGIFDPTFPHTSTGRPLSLMGLFLRQTAHPFRRLTGSIPTQALSIDVLRDPPPPPRAGPHHADPHVECPACALMRRALGWEDLSLAGISSVTPALVAR